MTETHPYTTQLQAGLGLMEETRQLLYLWQPGMRMTQLYDAALQSGLFRAMAARRLLNVVKECFAPRYLTQGDYPAQYLKMIQGKVPVAAFQQLLFLYTARANPILSDFVREVYWPRYTHGQPAISNDDAREFVRKANQSGKTRQSWSDSTVRRVSSYLTGCCADFGLLEGGTRKVRKIYPFRPEPTTMLWLAHDLHYHNLGDNAVIQHADWQLFGLEPEDVKQELRRLSLKGFFIIQTAGDVSQLSWTYSTWETFIHGLTE